MISLWKLVLLTVISAGASLANDIEGAFDLNSEANRPPPFLFPSESPRFTCEGKPSGFYADPRFECRVVHFCHEDGAVSSVSCDSDTGHSICRYRDVLFGACGQAEMYLALPQDPEDAPKLLPAPQQSTTPPSPESREVEGIFEVFNAVLREIQSQREVDTGKETASESPEDRALVEFDRRKNEKLMTAKKYNKGPAKTGPGDHPRRKRSSTSERYSVSRPYAVIYTKVPRDDLHASKPVVPLRNNHQRKDIREVPFVAARVPADVPTVPITIETRRKKKKSKSKKKNSSKSAPQTFYITEENDREHASEQQNVLYFSPEQAPGIGLRDPHGRAVVETQPRQNSDRHPTAQNPNALPPSRQQQPVHRPQSNQHAYPFHQLPSFPFLADLAPPHYFLENPDLRQQRGRFSLPFGLPDPFVFQPQTAPPDSSNSSPPREADSGRPQRQRQAGEARHPPRSGSEGRHPQTQLAEAESPQQQPPRRPSRPRNRPAQYQPEEVAFSQGQDRPSRPPEPHAMRQPQPHLVRQPEPHLIGQPAPIQPQPVGQFQGMQFRTMPLQQPVSGLNPPRHPEDPEAGRDYQQRGPQEALQHQRFPGFARPFFQEFPGLPFSEPFSQPGPQPYEVPPPPPAQGPPPGSRFQEQEAPPQRPAQQDRSPHPGSSLREQVLPQHLEGPLERPLPQPGSPRGPPSHRVRDQQVPGLQLEEGIVYLPQPPANPNLIEADRPRSERPRIRDHRDGQILVAIPQPVRNRARPDPENPRLRGQPGGNRAREQRPRDPTPSHSPPIGNPNEEGRYRQRTTPTSALQQHSTRPHREFLQSGRPQESPFTTHRHRATTPVPRQQPQRGQSSYYRESSRPPSSEQQLVTRPDGETSTRYRPQSSRTTDRTRSPHEFSHQRTRTSVAPPQYERTRSPEAVRTRPSSADAPSRGLAVTSQHFATPPPRPVQPEELNPFHPYLQPEEDVRTVPVSGRPRDWHLEHIESRPPPPEEVPRPQRFHHSYNSQHVQGNDLNNNLPEHLQVERPNEDVRTPTRQRGRPDQDRKVPASAIENGFLPVSDRPRKKYFHTTLPPEEDPRRPVKEDSRRPSKEDFRRPSEESFRRPPEEDFRRPPEEDFRRPPEEDFRRPSEESFRRPPEEDFRRPPEENFRRPPEDFRRPPEDFRRPPEELRRPDFERERHRERIPTTQAVTTTPKPTQKRRPPPPRPTFPAFPTFPPPPKRVITSPRPVTTQTPPEEEVVFGHRDHDEESFHLTTTESSRRTHFRPEVKHPATTTAVPEPDDHFATDPALEVTTRRRTRKRKPKRPRTTTVSFEEDEVADADDADAVTQATTRRELTTRPATTTTTTTARPATTRSTPSNYNRWRQQTTAGRRKSTTTTTPSPESQNDVTEAGPARSEEYGSRLNLFGRPRTRKPTSFAPRPTSTTTPSPPRTAPGSSSASLRTRKPFVKKVRKKVTPSEDDADVGAPVDRSDEDEDTLRFVADLNALHQMESATQLSVQDPEATTDHPSKGDDEGSRAVVNKFQSRSRVLKFGKPRPRPTESGTLTLSVGGSRA